MTGMAGLLPRVRTFPWTVRRRLKRSIREVSDNAAKSASQEGNLVRTCHSLGGAFDDNTLYRVLLWSISLLLFALS